MIHTVTLQVAQETLMYTVCFSDLPISQSLSVEAIEVNNVYEEKGNTSTNHPFWGFQSTHIHKPS